MSQCQSIHDIYEVRCTAGRYHAPHMLHIWQGYLRPRDETTTVVVWNDEESREHMNIEREFFRLAKAMTTDKKFAVVQYQTMIADLLIRLAAKEKKR